jgi:acyl-CoA synthetase (AMP-forming)/AMP-acid ligase II
MNTTDFLTIANAICPERDCIVFEGKRWAYAQTWERVNRLANALKRIGAEKGDRIGMLQVNCNQYVEVYYASAMTGTIFVPLNFRAKSDELSYMIANAEAKILFAGSRYLEMVDAILPELPTVKHCISIDRKDKKRLFYEDVIDSASSDESFFEIGD